MLYDAPMDLPEKAAFGETIGWQNKTDVESVTVDGVNPSEVDGMKLAVLGLYEQNIVWVHGVWKSEEKSNLLSQLNIFKHKNIDYFSHSIILEHPFDMTPPKLRLPSSVWKKVSQKSEEKKIYRQQMGQIKNTREGELTNSCWQLPMKSSVNSAFGKPRFLPSGHKYFHSGEDLKARTGTKIRSVAAGKVVFSRESIVPGKTVVLDHGNGIYSQYMHLSKFNVEVGDSVEPGQVIGLAGATGRVEGPHLHWEISWKGRRADPAKFVSAMSSLRSCPPQST